MAENTNLGEALDWEGEFDATDEFILLAPGYYPFTVKNLERERFQGSNKMAACPRAKLTLEVTAGNNTVNITDRIMLSTKTQWRVSQFFQSLGFAKDANGKMAMHWNEILEKTGWLKLDLRSYFNKDGEERESNEVTAYCRPDEADKAFEEYQKAFGVPAQTVTAAPATTPVPAQAPVQSAMPLPQQPAQYMNPSTGEMWSL